MFSSVFFSLIWLIFIDDGLTTVGCFVWSCVRVDDDCLDRHRTGAAEAGAGGRAPAPPGGPQGGVGGGPQDPAEEAGRGTQRPSLRRTHSTGR